MNCVTQEKVLGGRRNIVKQTGPALYRFGILAPILYLKCLVDKRQLPCGSTVYPTVGDSEPENDLAACRCNQMQTRERKCVK